MTGRPARSAGPPVAAAATLLTALGAALALGAAAYPPLGLADPGPVVRLLVPLLRAVADLAATATLGTFVLGLLLDARAGDPLPPRLRGAASTFAAAWAVAAAATAVATVADTSGGRITSGGDLVIGLLARATPIGWVATAVLAGVVAVWAREVRTWSSGAGAATLAVVALLGPVVTGHAIDGVGHDLGLPATAAHVVAATLWLATAGAALLRGGDGGARARRRATRIGSACAVVVVGSGLVQALVLVPTPEDYLTGYGVLVGAAAVVTLVALAVRTWRAPPPRSARRSAVVEIALLGGATGLSVALTRAVPPVQAPGHAVTSEAVLGYGLPDPPGVVTLLTAWRPDLLLGTVAVVLAVGYALALRRAPGWPRGRSAAWFAGCAVLVVATCSGLGRYGPALLSVHVAGHMLVAVAVPLLLVLGGPVTLLRRALPESPADAGPDAGPDGATEGPRDWLEHLLAAPALRLATHPLVATSLVVASPFLLYLTPVFALTQPVGWLQPVLTAWFLGTGLAFAWILVGVDPAPHRIPPPGRLALLLVSMPAHALFGVLLLATDRPISRTPATLSAQTGGGQVFVDDFYVRLRLPWAPDLLADQHLAAVLTWVMGDVPLLAVLGVLLVQWRRASAAEDRAVRGLLVGQDR